ncbi:MULTISPECIES: aldehyde dehydrogenase [Acetobacter]|uniref:aldehyde dehydrogenase n=1 Tax=Acetobacter TaxID=434 RepID=UPI000B63BA9D|nr:MULTISPECIES: aldehyde dehydrogenase [Acetobacter]MBS0959000.1 aldehyde dehydrogenase [Acetobacter thailandicus]MBS0980354.1 aldehyde dehydrogenase [Acetobacter thailandicus]MBS0985113.1 aldehyde dehydrogenase [Acetobacter thailandicus]MBS1003348.1 aldehyde dehydrogenase [Acetobacter thailandicus]OUJ11537.1 carnitine dehydratase [Acetobacter sp. DsW_059]
MKTFHYYIDGRFEDGEARFDSVDPSTGEVWANMPEARTADTDRAVKAADRALNDAAWRGLTAAARGKLLYRLGDLIEQHASDLADLETQDTGKIVRETKAQIAYVAEYYRYFAGLADKIEGRVVPVDKKDMDATTHNEPIGVVAAIVPWNSQLFLSAVKIAPAIAAGCTVVLKASEEAPAPLLAFAKLVHEAGFPPGVINIITGFGAECGRVLTSHPLVARVAFTGGPETARHVVRNTADNFAHLTLELGGKSPVMVFDDADLDSAANAIIASIFAATGQSCVAGSRLLIQRGVYDDLLARIVEKAKRIRIGVPSDFATEMGPLATRQQRDKIERVVAESLEAGATLITGGAVPQDMPQKGNYYLPTILDCRNTSAPALTEELFGPVLAVSVFDDEDDAVAQANSTRFGLASGLFTRDIGRTSRMVKRIRAGIVWVNTYRVIAPSMPFGGYGDTGYGREGGVASIYDYLRTKSVWIYTSDEPIGDPFVMR